MRKYFTWTNAGLFVGLLSGGILTTYFSYDIATKSNDQSATKILGLIGGGVLFIISAGACYCCRPADQQAPRRLSEGQRKHLTIYSGPSINSSNSTTSSSTIPLLS